MFKANHACQGLVEADLLYKKIEVLEINIGNAQEIIDERFIAMDKKFLKIPDGPNTNEIIFKKIENLKLQIEHKLELID